MRAETAVELKTNRYDAATRHAASDRAGSAAYRQQIGYWTDYFRDPARNGGLKPDLITDPTELRQFTAFVTWAAWASVADRPGEDYSYTNNFPYDPSVGNHADAGRAAVERAEPDRAARRHRRGAAGIRQVRLPGLDQLAAITSTRTCCRARPAPASARW